MRDSSWPFLATASLILATLINFNSLTVSGSRAHRKWRQRRLVYTHVHSQYVSYYIWPSSAVSRHLLQSFQRYALWNVNVKVMKILCSKVGKRSVVALFYCSGRIERLLRLLKYAYCIFTNFPVFRMFLAQSLFSRPRHWLPAFFFHAANWLLLLLISMFLLKNFTRIFQVPNLRSFFLSTSPFAFSGAFRIFVAASLFLYFPYTYRQTETQKV